MKIASESVAGGQWEISNRFHDSMKGASVNCFRIAMWLSKEKRVFDGCLIGWLFSLKIDETQRDGFILSPELKGWDKVDLVMPDHLKKALDEGKWDAVDLKEELVRFGSALHSLASIYGFVGQSKQALEVFEECRVIQSKVLGEEHPDYLTALANIAGVYKSMGKYEEALARYEAVRAVRLKVLGEEHLDYLELLRAMAVTHSRMGGFMQSIAILEKNLLVARRTRHLKATQWEAELRILTGSVKPKGPIKKAPKQKRNEKCACGSGKKYKDCCEKSK